KLRAEGTSDLRIAQHLGISSKLVRNIAGKRGCESPRGQCVRLVHCNAVFGVTSERTVPVKVALVFKRPAHISSGAWSAIDANRALVELRAWAESQRVALGLPAARADLVESNAHSSRA